MCNCNLTFITINGLMEWIYSIMRVWIYTQAKDVKLLNWLTNNNNYDMMLQMTLWYGTWY